MRVVEPSVELLAISKNAEELIELAGRTCYKSEHRIGPDSAARFIGMIKKRGHLSVIEHAYATFKFVADRGVSHELVRHRLCSFSQESTRYCNYGKADEISVVEPPDLTEGQRADWVMAMNTCEARYLSMIASGCTPQIARSVLPISLKTEIVTTANFREWMHIIDLRTPPAAHPQIRALILQVQRILISECKAVFSRKD